ncbi:hypothetical protein FDP41_000805 [Naegleria fowleri]|uniref:Uncharacterized protein n=1 Tax=Naegleria fowleri TaxID=5763 RepID=A0A6A5CB41_NAEFO|nr:uncharacterized protein FDP41_000805 [Naegleria fowleri]KAF0984906.1 hypothetical protein FDP41_000805 [Naegleria fowleri]CAG4715488.1 unnamed protein product [Naegleria fowleri]
MSQVIADLTQLAFTLRDDAINFLPQLQQTKKLSSNQLTLLNILHLVPYIFSFFFPGWSMWFWGFPSVSSSNSSEVVEATPNLDNHVLLLSVPSTLIRFISVFALGLIFVNLLQRKLQLQFEMKKSRQVISEIFIMMGLYFATLAVTKVLNVFGNFGLWNFLIALLQVAYYLVFSFHNMLHGSLIQVEKQKDH